MRCPGGPGRWRGRRRSSDGSRRSKDARRLARVRYDSGYSGYLDVLDADRNLLQSELDRVAARRDSLIASVDLIKSLGGGWSPTEVR